MITQKKEHSLHRYKKWSNWIYFGSMRDFIALMVTLIVVSYIMYYYGDKKGVKHYRSKRITRVENEDEFRDVKEMVERWETLKNSLAMFEGEVNATQR